MVNRHHKLPNIIHVNILHNKLLSNKRLLLNAQNLLPSKVLQHIYYAHVYSHLTYGLSVLGSLTLNKNKNNIYKLQTDCVKVFAKIHKYLSQSELFLQHAILPFPTLIKQELIKLGYKISNNQLPRPLIDLYKKMKVKRNET